MYVFQKNDLKYQAWAKSLADLDIETTAVEGSPVSAVLVLLRMLFARQPIQGYVFRYLNDYRSTAKTLLRLVSELGVIAIVKMVRGTVIWIAHNVDRESEIYHARLTQIRRNLVSRAAEVVLVTDPLLVPVAKELLPRARNVSWTCFGLPPQKQLNAETIRLKRTANALRERLRKQFSGARVLLGLCVSAGSPKCTHFLSATRFVDACTTDAEVVGMVVVGAVGRIRDRRFQSALREMQQSDRIELIAEPMQVSEQHLAEDFDFFYRAIDDLSVSFSVYVAASVCKPLVVESGTFLAEMVRHYELGAVVDSMHDPGLVDLAGKLDAWSPEAAKRFLVEHSWEVAAAQFERSMKRDAHAASRFDC